MSDRRNQNPPDEDFDFGDYDGGLPPGAPRGAPTGAPDEDLDLDFGFGGASAAPDEDFDFDDMPEAPRAAAEDGFGGVAADDFDDAVADGDAGDAGYGFGGDAVAEDADEDADGGGEDGFGFGDGTSDDVGADADYGVEFEGGDAAPEAADGAASAPADPKASLLSKLILPVGGAVGLGAIGLIGWPMFSGMLGMGGPAPAPQAVMAPAPQIPALPSPGLPAAQVPVLPTPPPVAPPHVAPPHAAPTAQPAPGLPGTALNRPSLVPPGVPTSAVNRPVLAEEGVQPGEAPAAPAPGALPGGIEDALKDLVAELRTLNGKVDGFDERLRTARSEIFERIDRADGKLEGVERRLGDVEGKVGGIEQRLAALEAARAAPAKPAAAPRKAAPAKAAKPAPKTLGGYMLRGVSRDAALVETPTGLLRVAIGQPVAGAGVAREIRREGGSWVLVTSGGLIRP